MTDFSNNRLWKTFNTTNEWLDLLSQPQMTCPVVCKGKYHFVVEVLVKSRIILNRVILPSADKLRVSDQGDLYLSGLFLVQNGFTAVIRCNVK